MRGLEYLENDDDNVSHEPIRRNNKPVNSHHDLQRRTENAMNRWRKDARVLKRGREDA